jgi:signal transduction histidine kinase/DNA-binding response OmpR family regulator
MMTTPDTAVRPRVLLVDDTPANLIALAAVLKPLGAELVEASSGAEALLHVAREEFAVVLLDVQMPEMDGFEVAARIRKMQWGRELPIIFLTAIHRDATFVKRGYASGAADYITKPFDADIVRARVKAFVDLFEQRESVRRAQLAIRTDERDAAIKKLVAFERIASAALGANDLNVFLRDLCAIFMDSADAADSVTILMRDGEQLREEACFGIDEEVDARVTVPIGEGFAGKIAAHRQPLEISGAASSPLVNSSWLRARGTNGLYGVPLLHEGGLVGVAHIGSRKAASFHAHEKALFQAVAQRATWAIAQHQQRANLLELERHARREAEQANRLKDEFLAIVSHELRSPLNAILGWTVTARAKAPPELERALSIIERNARAQSRIVDDILDVSRIVTGKLRLVIVPTSLANVVERAIDGVRPAAEAKRIDILSTVDPAACLEADPQRLQQIVWNLLSNAIKFSPKGSSVEVTARSDGEDAVITVTDRGEGIPPAFLPHVFESFRQADSSTTRRHGGLGLGLSIVKQIAVAHGGECAASSDGPGQGATFTITLPLRSVLEDTGPRELVKSVPPLGADPFRLEGRKVLVVDDEEDARVLLEDVLKDRGATIALACSANEGFDELMRFQPDVLVSDISMPGGDGYGLIRAVRALSADRGGRTFAIAVTAHARDRDGERAIAAGFNAYLSKPLDMERLITKIVELTRDGARVVQKAEA